MPSHKLFRSIVYNVYGLSLTCVMLPTLLSHGCDGVAQVSNVAGRVRLELVNVYPLCLISNYAGLA